MVAQRPQGGCGVGGVAPIGEGEEAPAPVGFESRDFCREELRQRVASQARDYGVSYIACGNTMKSLGWTAADMVDFAKIEDVGAAALMNFQKQGYAYIAW